MEECIFCKIIKEEIPSKTIYEDETVKVFLDINPNTNGDLLIIPKKHTENLFTIDNNTLNYILEIIKDKIYPILIKKLNATGLTISQNNGTGQEVKHFHIHITPRYEEDHLQFTSDKSILKNIDEIYNILTK